MGWAALGPMTGMTDLAVEGEAEVGWVIWAEEEEEVAWDMGVEEDEAILRVRYANSTFWEP